jgi:hypothetical protein
MNKNFAKILACAALLAGVGLAFARDELPWTFNGTRAEGYRIDLVSVTPEPGTPLVVGQPTDFKVTVRYENKVAPKATAILVFQPDKGAAKAQGEPQVKREVTEPAGTITLEDRVTMPKKAKELLLFIPLVPDGMTETNGEVVIRYPIRKK